MFIGGEMAFMCFWYRCSAGVIVLTASQSTQQPLYKPSLDFQQAFADTFLATEFSTPAYLLNIHEDLR